MISAILGKAAGYARETAGRLVREAQKHPLLTSFATAGALDFALHNIEHFLSKKHHAGHATRIIASASILSFSAVALCLFFKKLSNPSRREQGAPLSEAGGLPPTTP